MALKYRLLDSKPFTLALEGGQRFNRGDNLKVRLSDTGTNSIALGQYTWFPNEGKITTPSFSITDPQLAQPGFLSSSLTLSGVKDTTYFARLLGGIALTRNIVGSGYVEYGQTTVESEFQSDLSFLKGYIDKLGYDQTHYALGLGLDWRIWDDWIVAGYYRFIAVDRDIDDRIGNGFTINNMFTGQVHYLLNDNLAITLEGKAYTNNLLGEVNFLYNEFSYGQFDKMYGYAGLALTWAYNY